MSDESSISKSYVFFEGMSCLSTHWALCFGISMTSLFVSLLLLALLEDVRGDTDDSDVDSGQSGAWDFLFALMVFGEPRNPWPCTSCTLAMLTLSARIHTDGVDLLLVLVLLPPGSSPDELPPSSGLRAFSVCSSGDLYAGTAAVLLPRSDRLS